MRRLVQESLNENINPTGHNPYSDKSGDEGGYNTHPLYNQRENDGDSISDIKNWDYIDADIAITDIITPTIKKSKELMSREAFEIFISQLKEIISDYE